MPLLPKTREYPPKTKYKAVVLYNQVGSLRSVAETLGVRYDTMRQWHISEWWKEIEDDLKSQKRTKLSGQMVKLKDKAIEIVEDRLENGDFFYDQKTGELIRRPVGADVAAGIMRTALDKHLQMEEMALLEKKVASEEKITDRLRKLGEDFQRFAKAKEVQANADEGTLGKDVPGREGEVQIMGSGVATTESGESAGTQSGVLPFEERWKIEEGESLDEYPGEDEDEDEEEEPVEVYKGQTSPEN
jgi:hypothetical protein